MSQDALKIRVLAVDDHPPLREGIAVLIADGTDIALEQFRRLRPTVQRPGSGPRSSWRVPGPTAYCAGLKTCEDT